MIYLDNAATSFPKPESVLVALNNHLTSMGASAGRGQYQWAVEVSKKVFDVRLKLASLLGADDPLRVIFTYNATCAINMVLKGLLNPNDHVLISSMEHNAVVRPLRGLERTGVELDIIPYEKEGLIRLDLLPDYFKKNTRLLAVVGTSNVSGTIQPLKEIGALAQKHGVFFLVDGAQMAGLCPVEIDNWGIDAFAFTGHKSLYGPQGTGGVILSNKLASILRPLIEGGTGSVSEEEYQPAFLPDKFESGTMNTSGFLALGAGIDFLLEKGASNILEHERKLRDLLISRISGVKGIKIYGPIDSKKTVGILSFLIEDIDSSSVMLMLDRKWGIMVRAGLHCAPLAHKTLGSFPGGTIRCSFGAFNTVDEVETLACALEDISLEV